jgi:hypothetical protein
MNEDVVLSCMLLNLLGFKKCQGNKSNKGRDCLRSHARKITVTFTFVWFNLQHWGGGD